MQPEIATPQSAFHHIAHTLVQDCACAVYPVVAIMLYNQKSIQNQSNRVIAPSLELSLSQWEFSVYQINHLEF